MDKVATVTLDEVSMTMGLLLDRAKEISRAFAATRRTMMELQENVDRLVQETESLSFAFVARADAQ